MTWEAIESTQVLVCTDVEYLVSACAHRASPQYDLQIFVDHRMSGAASQVAMGLRRTLIWGIRTDKLVPCGAAIVSAYFDGPLPTMIWPTNYTKLGAATMFTLLFAGE